MKQVTRMAAQGDLLLRKVSRLPDGLTEVAAQDGELIIAHSETGHNHVVGAEGCKLFQGADPLVAYLVAETVQYADVLHRRGWDQHETLRLCGEPGSIWEIRRQREHTPEGWRRVHD